MAEEVVAEFTINDADGPRVRCQVILTDERWSLRITDRERDALEEMRVAAVLGQFLRDNYGWKIGELRHVDDHDTPLTFGRDIDKPMDRVQRRRESWRRSSRKYRAKKAVKQTALFDEETTWTSDSETTS